MCSAYNPSANLGASNHPSRNTQKAPYLETEQLPIDIVPLQFMVIYPARDLINNSAPVTGSQSRFVARGPKQSQPRVDDSINYDKRAGHIGLLITA